MSPFDSLHFFNYEVSPVSLSVIFTVVYLSYYIVLVREYPKLVCSNPSLKSFLYDKMMVTKQIYWPLLWGFEATIQTILGSVFRSHRPVTYERELFILQDGGEVFLDWADAAISNSGNAVDEKNTPICVFLPGLTGCSQSNYITHLVNSIVDKKFRAVVFNYRGKGGSKLKTPRTYCALSIDDFNDVLVHVRERCPGAPVMACGISLGGMILFNYLAKTGQRTALDAAMIISVAWNIGLSVVSLERPVNRILFNKTLAEALAADVKDNSELFESTMDLNTVFSSQTIREFDTHFTTRVFGYSSVDEYYRMASPHMKLASIKIPLLCLNSGDDPFAPLESIPFEAIRSNPYVAMILTSHGGHVGFLEGLWPRGMNIMDKVLQQFSSAVFSGIEDFRKTFHNIEDLVSLSDSI